jgi:uncharacterized membrane protein YkvA (DUF1232 family)
MFGRFKILQQLLATGRLAWRLVRDPRVPMATKLILGATALYLGSPIDVVPDWFPVVGQADDVMAVLAGLTLFIKACPRWLVEEHERQIGQKPGASTRDDSVIEGRYRVKGTEGS